MAKLADGAEERLEKRGTLKLVSFGAIVFFCTGKTLPPLSVPLDPLAVTCRMFLRIHPTELIHLNP